MRREVALLSVLAGCGVPVDIGVLDETSGNSGSSGPITDDATQTDSMTGPLPPTSVATSEATSDTAEPPLPLGRRDFAIVEGAVTESGEGETGEAETGTAGSSASTSATSTSGTDSGDPVPLGTLDITATTGNATCEDPFAADPCPATWTYSFSLPPELQFVGAAGRLEDTGGFFSEAGGDAVDCGFGGGELRGNFEITAIDETHVAGRMFDLEGTMWETAIDFDAPICP